MRVLLAAVFGLITAACGGQTTSKTGEPLPPLSLEQLEADAPVGPLPSSPYPTFVELDLTIDPREARFGGIVAMTIKSEEPIRGFYLHGRDITVTDVWASPDAISFQDSAKGTWTDVLPSGVAWVDFGRMIDADQISVAIEYDTAFDVNLSGLFKVTEQGDAYALAKSESIQARRFMPGFDQPAFKAPYKIELTIPSDMSAISNAPEAAVFDRGDSKAIVFETTRPLPTYLLSLAVGSFDVVDAGMIPPNEVRSEPIPLRGFARRGKGSELAYALETAPELVRVFEEALQLPYPYKKLDIVAAPQWPSGATELAAAITYRESRILAGPDMGPAARRSLLAIHAHEVGHMWFGNLVTPPWWDDLWLKEAFASWGEGASLSEIYPGEGYKLDAIADGIRVMWLDSLSSARAVREPIALNENVRNAYDGITYNKGLAIIGMVDAYFGANKFRPALGKYVEAYEDGVADSPQFFDIIGDVTGEPDLTKAFRSFVEQNGLPLLTLSPSTSDRYGNSYVIKQSRYAPLGSEIEQNRKWTIPFCYKTGIADFSRRDCQLNAATDQAVPLIALTRNDLASKANWILPNAGGTGYWRFSMPYEMWQDLGRAFSSLEPGEKLSTLDSIGAEFAAGRIDPLTVWRFIDEAVHDEERRVVQAAIREAIRFERLVSENPEALSAYRAGLIDLFKHRYDELAEKATLSDDETILKTSLENLLVRSAKDETLRSDLALAAANLIRMEGASSQRQLSTDEYASALAIGMQTYGKPFMDRLLEARGEIDDPVFEQAVAYAIGQNTDLALNADILGIALTGELGSRESYSIVGGQMAQPETRASTWAWLQDNFIAYSEVIPRQRKRAMPSLAASLCTAEGRTQLQDLFAKYGDRIEGHQRALNQTTERISLCAALKEAKGDEVKTFFKREY